MNWLLSYQILEKHFTSTFNGILLFPTYSIMFQTTSYILRHVPQIDLQALQDPRHCRTTERLVEMESCLVPANTANFLLDGETTAVYEDAVCIGRRLCT